MWEENGKISADLYYRQQRCRKVDSDAWARCFVSIAGAAYWQALLATVSGENAQGCLSARVAQSDCRRKADYWRQIIKVHRQTVWSGVIVWYIWINTRFFCSRRVIRRALLYLSSWYVRGQQRADKLPFYFKFSADNRTDNDGLGSDKSAEIWFFMVHNDRDTAELVRRLRQEAWTQWFRPLVF